MAGEATQKAPASATARECLWKVFGCALGILLCPLYAAGLLVVGIYSALPAAYFEATILTKHALWNRYASEGIRRWTTTDADGIPTYHANVVYRAEDAGYLKHLSNSLDDVFTVFLRVEQGRWI